MLQRNSCWAGGCSRCRSPTRTRWHCRPYCRPTTRPPRRRARRCPRQPRRPPRQLRELRSPRLRSWQASARRSPGQPKQVHTPPRKHIGPRNLSRSSLGDGGILAGSSRLPGALYRAGSLGQHAQATVVSAAMETLPQPVRPAALQAWGTVRCWRRCLPRTAAAPAALRQAATGPLLQRPTLKWRAQYSTGPPPLHAPPTPTLTAPPRHPVCASCHPADGSPVHSNLKARCQ